MTKKAHETPLLNELKGGPWPGFVEGLERLASDGDKPSAIMMKDLLGQLEHSYENHMGYWKGGTVSVFGYGGGVIPRCSEVAEKFPESSEFHTLRVQPPAGMHYSTELLRDMCDSLARTWFRADRSPRPVG
jgi:sulfite reductase alpha subunit